MKKIILFSLILIIFYKFSNSTSAQSDDYKFEGEKHLSNISMLTNGGENAEAYLSFDEKELIFQATVDELTV